MFMNTQMGGMSLAAPDVLLVPAVPAPIPTPFPNMANGMTAIPAQFKCLVTAMPAHNLATITPMTQGGVGVGVVSGMCMGPSRHMVGSTNVMIGGAPATKMLNPTGQNGPLQNVPGCTIAPSQTKVMCMR